MVNFRRVRLPSCSFVTGILVRASTDRGRGSGYGISRQFRSVASGAVLILSWSSSIQLFINGPSPTIAGVLAQTPVKWHGVLCLHFPKLGKRIFLRFERCNFPVGNVFPAETKCSCSHRARFYRAWR